MVELPSLYPHQERFVSNVRSSLARTGATIACGVTGFGKSRIAKWILGAAMNKQTRNGSGYYLFAVHRRGLVDNIAKCFAEEPEIPAGIIMSGQETSHFLPIQLASIDTLLSWWCEGGQYNVDRTFDLIVFDETHAHLGKLKTFLQAHNAHRRTLGLPEPFILGLTATPRCQGLSDVYRDIVTGPTGKWLQDFDFAARFRYMGGKQGRLSKLKKRAGRYTNESVHVALDRLQGDFVRDWVKYAQGRPTIGFFPFLEHAREAQELLLRRGVRAEYVDGKTPDIERRELYRGLADSSYDYLCNVGVTERGTDIPAAACIQLCTCIGSLVRYRQILGRGARVHPSKEDTLVLDHGGNVKTHGYWEEEVNWTLDYTTKESNLKPQKYTIQCPKCGNLYRGGKCRNCEYEPTKSERQSQGLVFDGQELVEYTKRERTTPKATDPEKILVSCLWRAGRSGCTWKQAVGMFGREIQKRGMPWTEVPKTFTATVRGERKVFQSIPKGHPDGACRVSELFEFNWNR